MYCRAFSMIAAGIWAMALSAQTPPWRFPGVPQFTLMPQARAVRPEIQGALRQLLKSDSPEKTAVCSIPLLEAPVAKNVERIPTFRPRVDNIDHMPLVKLPAPPCQEEEKR
jgi:hypothetical protein